MRIEIRNDSVVLDGYVTAVKRDSRPIPSQRGKFIEQIEERAFQNALDRAQNIDLLLNHDTNKHLGSTKEGNLELFEDNIGLRAICTVTDADVIVNSPVEIPNTPNVKVKHACSVFLNAYGGATHVVNNTGAAVS